MAKLHVVLGVGAALALGCANAQPPAPSPAKLGIKMTDPDAPGLAFERWTKPEDSSFQPLERIAPHCWSELGCPFAAVSIAACPTPIEALSVAEAQRVAGRHQSAPPKLFVNAELVANRELTAMGCAAATCCNYGGGEVVLSDDADAIDPGAVLFLSSRTKRDAFNCGGDDSTTCCGFQAAKVIAFGVVHEQKIIDPLLCKP